MSDQHSCMACGAGASPPMAPGNGAQPASPAGEHMSHSERMPPTQGSVPPPVAGGVPHGSWAVPPALAAGHNMSAAGMPPPPPGTSRPPTSRSRRGPIAALLATIAAVLLLCAIGGAILIARGGGPDFSGVARADDAGRDTVAGALVGECLAGDSAGDSAGDDAELTRQTDLRVVDCTDADARYTVVGRIEDRTREQADDEVCQPYDRAELTYWDGRSGQAGTVLCLEKNL